MQNNSSNEVADDPPGGVGGASIQFPLPVRGPDLFKHGATPYILNFLGDNPELHLSIRQLSRVAPMSERATREAVDTLEANDLIETFHSGNARMVRINRERFDKPDDPILSIPQPEFQMPVRVAVQYLKDELEDIRGIILFGSVARGTADRRSDIDLWILVESDHMEQRHRANELSQHLDGLQIPPSVAVLDAMNVDVEGGWEQIRERIEDDDWEWSSAERYSFEILVESSTSILGQSDRIEPEHLFGESITLHSTESLERVKKEVFSNE